MHPHNIHVYLRIRSKSKKYWIKYWFGHSIFECNSNLCIILYVSILPRDRVVNFLIRGESIFQIICFLKVWILKSLNFIFKSTLYYIHYSQHYIKSL